MAQWDSCSLGFIFHYLFCLFRHLARCVAPRKCSTDMLKERINSVTCKMQRGKHDSLARCLRMAWKALPPAPVPHSAPGPCSSDTTYSLASHTFALTAPLVWKVPPLSLCTAGSFSLFTFLLRHHLGRAASDHLQSGATLFPPGPSLQSGISLVICLLVDKLSSLRGT